MPEERKSTYTGQTDARRKASAKYLRETVEDIRIRVPKGKKAIIAKCAESLDESVNEFVVRAINDRLNDKLTAYYSFQWGKDDSKQIRLAETYEERIIPAQIVRLENKIADKYPRFIRNLYLINRDFTVRLLTSGASYREKCWSLIEDEYEDCIDDLHNFFDPFIERFDEELGEMKEDYIQGHVARDMESPE